MRCSVLSRLSLAAWLILGSIALIPIAGCGEDVGASRGSINAADAASKGVMAESKADVKAKRKRGGGPPAGPKNFKSLKGGADN